MPQFGGQPYLLGRQVPDMLGTVVELVSPNYWCLATGATFEP